MTKITRDLYSAMLLAVLANSLLWLDSLESYLNNRYHIYLSEYLPEHAFKPSRVLRMALAPKNHSMQPASIITPVAPVMKAQPDPMPATLAPLALMLPASASAVSQVAPLDTAQQQARIKPASHPDQAEADVTELVPKVLFAGDSMMQGVAPMVIKLMRKDFPKGVFVDVSKPSTGLASRKYFDWPAKIREECIKHNIQIIVMFLGPNDPWDIFEGKKRYTFPSEDWEEKYRSRVDDVMDFATASGIRVIWIGLPAMRDERIQQGAVIENRIFQGEAQKYKFDYLSTEEFLGSLDAPYTKFIDDPKQGKLAVRMDDGVHFTHLGLRMISSRVDERLRKQDKL